MLKDFIIINILKNIKRKVKEKQIRKQNIRKSLVLLKRSENLFHQRKNLEALHVLSESYDVSPEITFKYCDSFVSYLPNTFQTYLLRGFIYEKQAEYHKDKQKEFFEKALKDYNKAIDLQPANSSIYNLRAKVYEKMFDYKKALENYNKAIEIAPNKAEGYKHRALFFAKMENYANALEDYHTTIKLEPNEFNDTYQSFKEKEIKETSSLTRLFLKNYPFQAYVYADRQIELNPHEAVYFSIRAAALYDMRENDNALKDYDMAITLNPKCDYYYSSRAWLQLILQKPNKALADVNNAIKYNKKDKTHLFLRARIYFELKLFREVISDCKKIIDLDFLKKQIYLLIAVSYLEINKKITSLKYIKKATLLEITQLDRNSLFNEINIDTKKIINSLKTKIPIPELFTSKNSDLKYAVQALIILFKLDNKNAYISSFYKKYKSLNMFINNRITKKEFSKVNNNFFVSYSDYLKWRNEFIQKDKSTEILKYKIDLLNEFLNFFTKEKKSSDEKDTQQDIEELTSLGIIIQEKLLDEYESRLNKREDKLKKAQVMLENVIQQYTHTISNTLFPNTIYEVAQRLKKHANYKKDAMILTDAYHAELFMKHQGQLLAVRNTTSAKSFQSYIRGDRLDKTTKEEYVTIEHILNNSAERVVSRFLNDDYHKLDKIRTALSTKFNVKLETWKDDFEREVFFKEENAINWINHNFAKIKMSISEIWSNILLKKNRYAEALLQGYFAELFFNAMKYRDQQSDIWIEIEFSELKIDDEDFLVTIWKNSYIRDKNISISSNKGLLSIKNDLEMLNETEDDSKTLYIEQGDELYNVKLYFKKDLFILPDKKGVDINRLFEEKGGY